MDMLNRAIEKHKQKILDAERFIWQHPETGFKEYETSKYMENVFRDLGYELVLAEDIPGFYTVLDTQKPGPEILILAELDSIICPEHKDANPVTGAVHSCGHNAQCAALVGIAAALKEPEVLDALCGRIRLCVVPAEELLEIEFREELKQKGIIKYFGGKPEFLSRGYFDGVDMAFMVHTSTFFGVHIGSVGCLAKVVTYQGVAAHAGVSPWEGKNALYAATCGINAINALRETFKESDIVRVHPVITNGGSMVSAIPEKVILESYIRGASFDAICKANKKVNQALCGAALSLGVNVDICDTPGYAPLKNDVNLMKIAEKATKLALPEYTFTYTGEVEGGCTDLGDLSCVMPVVQAYAAGVTGRSHGSDYEIADPISACVGSAKMQLSMLFLLLSDGAKEAMRIIGEFTPEFASKEEYLSFVDGLNRSGNRLDYQNENNVIVNL